eukprot:1140453-Pelagomonas_calceolata.AAC.2
MGIWRVSGSTRFQNLNRMGMKFASKFIGALVAKLSVTCSTAQDSDVRMLPLCHLYFLSRPRVFRVLDFNLVHVSLCRSQAEPRLSPIPSAEHTRAAYSASIGADEADC